MKKAQQITNNYSETFLNSITLVNNKSTLQYTLYKYIPNNFIVSTITTRNLIV